MAAGQDFVGFSRPQWNLGPASMTMCETVQAMGAKRAATVRPVIVDWLAELELVSMQVSEHRPDSSGHAQGRRWAPSVLPRCTAEPGDTVDDQPHSMQ